MNGITGAIQGSNPSSPENLPPSSFETLDRLDNGFAPADPTMTRAEWLEQARTSTSPAMQAYYNELVTLAGGRTDDAALNQVIDRYQALQNATTASEVIAAERGFVDQIGTMLNRFDPIDRLRDAVQPQIASIARQAGLADTEWGASLQGVLDATGSLGAFRDGLRSGMLAGAQDMVVGTLQLAGRTLQYGADSSISGHAGDVLRDYTGDLPGVLDAIIPSAERGAATTETLRSIGRAVGDYIGAIAADPGKLPADIVNAINAQWSNLQASHDAAAAQGGEALAQWWGETIGRVAFEVGSTFIPVAGQAGRGARIADTAVDVADAAVDTSRLLTAGADDLADAAHLANRADDAGDATRLTPNNGSTNGGGPAGGTGGPNGSGGPDRTFIGTDRGVVISDDVLALQGTSRLVGDFRGIQGARVEEIISRVPSDWTMLPQQRGMGIRFIDDTGAERLRLHGPSARAPEGSNAASGWTARVHVPGTSNQYYDNLGNIVGARNNDGHIPVYGNANLD
ncbi:polymorphic toxin type 30 domain-containing protein [Erythrobacter sp. YT30]|uniref:polymorphic toxin type 30 domain-containing protein n=1 Tax=Erythrobacter sp. YT30 TaxID=1735012 RepID=UPI00076DB05E|nr:polymorphic toxin type 30 domain-containing protein [Erythrobacter sp. YT30]KWV92091.1 hypothetical protein AUC45_13170 [Erythrobacter sp. YT30]